MGFAHNNFIIVKYNVYSILLCIFNFIFIVIREFISTKEYLKNKIESDKLKEIEILLYNLMPQHVFQNLKEDIPVADELDNVTLLFTGIF
jgi:hypothetical protein